MRPVLAGKLTLGSELSTPRCGSAPLLAAIFTSAYSAEPTADDVRLSREHASREILI